MKNYRRMLAVALTLFMVLLTAHKLSAAHEATHELRGRIIRVFDGDTVTLQENGGFQTSIRLAGIDAPENKMAYGVEAQAYLARLVINKEVVAIARKQDRYGRTVATVFLETDDVNLSMLKAGMAWHYKKYENEQSVIEAHSYARMEFNARNKRIGLWQYDSPMPPWEWREFRKNKARQFHSVSSSRRTHEY